MRGLVCVASLVALGCGGHRPPPNRTPAAASDWRCVLRISPRGTVVDGEPMSRAAAVEYCKRAPGGAVVIIDHARRSVWSATADDMVVIEDSATKAAWDKTRSALEREGVRIYVRGPLCHDPRPLACRPISTTQPETEPVRRPIRAAGE